MINRKKGERFGWISVLYVVGVAVVLRYILKIVLYKRSQKKFRGRDDEVLNIHEVKKRL